MRVENTSEESLPYKWDNNLQANEYCNKNMWLKRWEHMELSRINTGRGIAQIQQPKYIILWLPGHSSTEVKINK